MAFSEYLIWAKKARGIPLSFRNLPAYRDVLHREAALSSPAPAQLIGDLHPKIQCALWAAFKKAQLQNKGLGLNTVGRFG